MFGQTVRTRTARGVAARLLVALLTAGLLGVPGAHTAQAATATVGNGITTTDLNAIGMSATALATDLMGPGVTGISNVTYTGDHAQAGTVDLLDPAVVSFNHGVVLSTGNVADIVGPNKSEGTTGVMTGASDADLTSLIASTATVNPMTYDASVLEFDFTPNASTVYFTYVFGSDEYLEWVNLFNDVFAFYVNGTNCATVGGGSPVSIDTINSTVNAGSYRDNSFASPPANPINIESDGLSVELICHAAVNPGVPNHIKLAIADTSDQVLDSIVMIKSASLSTTPPESCNNGTDDNGDTLVDMSDPLCQSTTTPPPPGGSGVGSGNTPPPFTGNEGDAIPLDASALGWSAAPYPAATTTSWTVTPINGTAGSCSIQEGSGQQPVGAGGAIAVVHAICTQDGEYAAKVEGWAGASSEFDKDVDFFVHNAPPSVTIDAPTAGSGATIGATVNLATTVLDPGTSDTVTCSADWGDGSVGALTWDSGAQTCSGSHTYGSAANPIISVTATDNAGASSAAAVVLAVTDGVTKTEQVISWTVPPPASSHYGDQFTVAASGGGSGNALLYGATGGCTNAGADYTMSSSTIACSISVDQAGNDSYSVAATVTETAGTAKRALTATADAASKTYGQADPAFTYVLTGTLVGADTLVGAIGRDPGEAIGDYNINQGTLTATPDYSLAFVPALFSILDGTPTAAAPDASLRTGTPLVGTAIPITLAWSGDAVGGAALHHYQVARSTGSCAAFGAPLTVPSGLASVAWNTTVPSTGKVCFKVRAVDAVGNPSAWAVGPLLTPRLTQQSSSLIKYVKTWTLASSAKYSGATEKWSRATSATATYKVTAKSIALVITRGAGRGKVKIWVDGVVVKASLDTKAGSTQYRYVSWQTALTPGSHLVKITVLGTAGRPRVDLDAFAVLQ